jgi:hypothetical protein
MRPTLRTALVAALLGGAISAHAQRFTGYPGTHIAVDMQVSSITHAADSIRVTYVLHSQSFSEEQLFDLTIDAPVPARNLSLPLPRKSWASSTRVGDRSVINWTVLDNTSMKPGKSSPPLSFTANGLPGIVSARAEGYADPPDIDAMADDDPRLTDRAFEVTSVPITVVGVVAPLMNQTRAALIARLLGLAQQTCTLGWTTDAQICAALNTYLNAPSPKLLAFLGAVVVARTRPGVFNDNAYWLLRSNAEIIRDFVDVTGIRLTYRCGNTFQIQNANFVPVSVRYEVVGTTEGATVTVPGLLTDDGASPVTKVTTAAPGTVQLLYQGTVIQTATDGNVACTP